MELPEMTVTVQQPVSLQLWSNEQMAVQEDEQSSYRQTNILTAPGGVRHSVFHLVQIF